VDGDQDYQSHFNGSIEKLLPSISRNREGFTIVEAMSEHPHLFIRDFLRIHKNARTDNGQC
jgi:hypothetical protein